MKYWMIIQYYLNIKIEKIYYMKFIYINIEVGVYGKDLHAKFHHSSRVFSPNENASKIKFISAFYTETEIQIKI